VKHERIAEHPMHEERYEVSERVAGRVTAAKREGKRVLAVGTTSVRTLESARDGRGVRAGVGRTSLFIRPGAFEFRVVDRLLTNFHLPKSTLFMLVCAFAGHDLVMAAYEEAVREKYRFFSYGDAMLVL
jgi:S-adenosylmethionine:tRNA ribosyltransferase-isomerase